MDMNKQIFTINELCVVAGISRSCYYSLLRKGKIAPPDVVLSARLKFYSKDKFKSLMWEIFKIDIDLYSNESEESGSEL